MSNKEYKKYIIEMLQKIDNDQHLKRIFNYVHRYFISERSQRLQNRRIANVWKENPKKAG